MESDKNKKSAIFFKRLRVSAKLTQSELANKIGTSRQYVTNIENGKVDYPLSKFINLCYKINQTDFNAIFKQE